MKNNSNLKRYSNSPKEIMDQLLWNPKGSFDIEEKLRTLHEIELEKRRNSLEKFSINSESKSSSIIGKNKNQGKNSIHPQPHLICFVCLKKLFLHSYRSHISSKHRIYELPDSLILPQFIYQRVFFEIFNKKAERIHNKFFSDQVRVSNELITNSSEGHLMNDNLNNNHSQDRNTTKMTKSSVLENEWDILLQRYLKKEKDLLRSTSIYSKNQLFNNSLELDTSLDRNQKRNSSIHNEGNKKSALTWKSNERKFSTQIRNKESSTKYLDRHTLHKPTSKTLKREIFVSSPGTIPACIQGRFAFHNLIVNRNLQRLCLFGGCRLIKQGEINGLNSNENQQPKTVSKKVNDQNILKVNDNHLNLCLTNSILEFVPSRQIVKNSTIKTSLSDNWSWLANGGRWEEIEFEGKLAPSPRMHHTAIEFNGKIYVYGGETQNGLKYKSIITSKNQLMKKDEPLTICSDLYEFDLETRTWKLLLKELNEIKQNNEDEISKIRQENLKKANAKFENIVKELENLSLIPRYEANNTIQKKFWKDKDLTMYNTDQVPALLHISSQNVNFPEEDSSTAPPPSGTPPNDSSEENSFDDDSFIEGDVNLSYIKHENYKNASKTYSSNFHQDLSLLSSDISSVDEYNSNSPHNDEVLENYPVDLSFNTSDKYLLNKDQFNDNSNQYSNDDSIKLSLQNSSQLSLNISKLELTLEQERSRIKLESIDNLSTSKSIDQFITNKSQKSNAAEKDFINTQQLSGLRKLGKEELSNSEPELSGDPMSEATCTTTSHSYLGRSQVIEDVLSDIDSRTLIEDSEPLSQPLSHISENQLSELGEDVVSADLESKSLDISSEVNPQSEIYSNEKRNSFVEYLSENNNNHPQKDYFTEFLEQIENAKQIETTIKNDIILDLRPPALSRHSCIIRHHSFSESYEDIINSLSAYLVIYGGKTNDGEASGDIWQYNFHKELWIKSFGPPSRYSHIACFDASKDRMIVFGGLSATKTPLNDLWIYRFDNDTSRPIHPELGNRPPARYGHTAMLKNNNLFIFGGTNGKKYFNDCWIFNFNTGLWTELFYSDPISGRSFHGLVSLDKNHIVTLGGKNGKLNPLCTAYFLTIPKIVDEELNEQSIIEYQDEQNLDWDFSSIDSQT